MASLRDSEQALFIVGILASDRERAAMAAERLVECFGPAALGGLVWPFDNTGYYLDELGPNPVRTFLAFPGLFDTGVLSGRKLLTNRLEIELAAKAACGLPRPINLDPGYVTLAKLVLASAKNYSHRVHIGGRIYAEVTLQYRQRRWRALPWTFPDYASGRYDGFLLDARNLLETEGKRLDRQAKER